MKKFDYKEVGKEIGWNFSNVKYSVEHLSDYNYYKEVVGNIKESTIMLDIGCGSGEKSTRYYSLAKKVYFTDIEKEMLKRAKANVKKYYEGMDEQKKKFSFSIMDCGGPYNFSNEYFDLIVSRHCGANMKEVYRVLKKGGVFISEDYSSEDCQELKDVFKRGQEYNLESLSKKIMNECYESGFSAINFLRFEEVEYYKSVNDLKYLLHNTPILGGFDEEKDNEKLQEYINQFSTPKGIRLNRRLYAFTLKK